MKRLTTLAVVFAVGLGALAFAVTRGDEPTASDSTPAVPRKVIFPDKLVYASQTKIYANGKVWDIGPDDAVSSLTWTPYGLYLLVGEPLRGPVRWVFFDGKMHEIDVDAFGPLVASRDGELVAYVDQDGPIQLAGQVAEIVVIATKTGERIFSSHEGMGGEVGDDLGARYAELRPRAVSVTDDEVVWRNASGSGEHIESDLKTGASRAAVPVKLKTNKWHYLSPDGEQVVEVLRPGKLRVWGHPFAFEARYQQYAGWLDNTTLLVIGRDQRPGGVDLTKPDRSLAPLFACDLTTDRCTKVANVRGPDRAVFNGLDSGIL